MVKVLKTIQSFYYVLIRVSWLKIIKRQRKDSENIVLLFADFPRNFFKYFYADSFINDMALLEAIVSQNIDFQIVIGKKKLLNLSRKSIFLNLGNRFRKNDNSNYSEDVIEFVSMLEEKNNKCYPSHTEALWWENKAYMHHQFDELGIKTPPSKVVTTRDFQVSNLKDFTFPMLIKEVHSAGSLGVYKIENEVEATRLVNKIKAEEVSKHIILQKLLTMDRDLRVIVIGEKIVLHYYRINKGKEWKPTSTKHGSGVDFDYFPNEWSSHILQEFKKLKITTGAFDLVWEHNDYTQTPYVLEVSPSYQPNPKPPSDMKGSYGQFKAGFRWKESYPKRFVAIVFELKQILIQTYFSKN